MPTSPSSGWWWKPHQGGRAYLRRALGMEGGSGPCGAASLLGVFSPVSPLWTCVICGNEKSDALAAGGGGVREGADLRNVWWCSPKVLLCYEECEGLVLFGFYYKGRPFVINIFPGCSHSEDPTSVQTRGSSSEASLIMRIYLQLCNCRDGETDFPFSPLW